ncbi:MATE family efflux transporter [Roseicyclus marinus]|uniref:MATE family efflux transporter n=1 Tax=Roseicyclus marinus TaxID=2161673 RepID=UPI00240FAA98|nr:MATE family efflux transporter [Roseicyclus marinus]MDG3039774.1 MATE family efflux transporter [Roseicyclus marinus]
MSGSPAVFLQGSLMRHVVVMSLTSSIGLMAVFAVDFVDMVFIAMLGNDALAAAIGYAGTILFFTNSINIGLAIVAGSLCARAIGAGDSALAGGHATTVSAIGIAVGILVPLAAIPALPALLGLLGAEGEVARLAARYLTIILPSMSVMAVAMIAMAVLRAHGDARRAMLATLYGGTVNAVLDPILIFGLGLGLDGAAIASVIARFVILAAALSTAISRHDAFALPNATAIATGLRAALALAVPAVLTNIATPVGTAIVTREVARFGTEAVAGMAVIGRLTPLAFAVVFALSGAIGPIIGQNFGAGRHDRVRAAFDAAVLFTLGYVVVAAAILFVLRGPITDLFAAEGEARALILLFCGPLALASFFNGVIFVSNASFNNLGRPGWSTAINWGRHTLGTWPFVTAGAALGGAAGALVGQAAGGVLFAALAWLLARRLMDGTMPPDGQTPGDPFAVQHSRWQILTGRHR